jgi:thiamine pyrophosphokinase
MTNPQPPTPTPPAAWVIAAGPEAARPAWPWLPPPDFVVCADGGLNHAARLGLDPQVIIGDFDSAEPGPLAAALAAPDRYTVARYQHETKLETDTELAVLAALDRGATRLILTGALGGRWDHSLANVLLLAHPRLAGQDVRIVTADTELRLLRGPATLALDGWVGDTVSLLAFSPVAEGITTTGLHYPLAAEPLHLGLGRGISNVLAAPPAAVTLAGGDLLVVVTHVGNGG